MAVITCVEPANLLYPGLCPGYSYVLMGSVRMLQRFPPDTYALPSVLLPKPTLVPQQNLDSQNLDPWIINSLNIIPKEE